MVGAGPVHIPATRRVGGFYQTRAGAGMKGEFPKPAIFNPVKISALLPLPPLIVSPINPFHEYLPHLCKLNV